jgi:hypothetical protein
MADMRLLKAYHQRTESGRLSHCAPGGAALRPDSPILPLPVMTRTNVRPSLWARCRSLTAMGSGLRHAVQVEPGIDLLAAARQLRTLAAAERRRGAAPFWRARHCGRMKRFRRCDGFCRDWRSVAEGSAAALAARGFLRSGFVCLATLSHSARSSSLNARLRLGGAGSSRIGIEERRFIGRGGNDDSDDDGGGARPGPA